MFRWVEDKKVSDRIIEIWPSIVKIVNHWSKLAPSKQPKCKSYEVLKGAVKDPLIVAKLNFFSFLAGHLLPYLTSYQSQKPMISFLHSNLQQLVKELLSLTIKSELIDKCKENSKSLLKIDLRDVNNHIKKICTLVLAPWTRSNPSYAMIWHPKLTSADSVWKQGNFLLR